MPERFTLDTQIGHGWRCSQQLAAFFREHSGKGFRFNADLRDFIHTQAGKTLAQALDCYKNSVAPGSPAREIAPQFEYNQHTRDYYRLFPNATREQVIAAWWQKRHRSRLEPKISETIQSLILKRFPSSICPSEVARALSPIESEWRALMPAVRQAAQAMAKDGRLQITQRGRVLPADQPLTGAIRLIALNPKETNVKRSDQSSATREAGLTQLRLFIGSGASGVAYAKARNFDLGPGAHQNVSRLSAYLRYRLVREDEALKMVLQTESADKAEKFIQEVCWRTYWKGWLEHQPQVWQQYVGRRDRAQALSAAQTRNLEALLANRCGIDCMDAWVSELRETGYLHNHARMWFASIWIFTLNLPWELGADFFMCHLLDADPASNTLSWRWVAGLQTIGKHYLARAENIARYTNGRFNPAGLLNEQALPLTEDGRPFLHARTDEGTSTSHTFVAGLYQPTPDERPVKTVLVVHEDDLTPELLLANWKPSQKIVGLVAVNTSKLRSTQALGEPALNFSIRAFDDAIERITARFDLPTDAVHRVPSVQVLGTIFTPGETFEGCAILLTPPPVGPCRDALVPIMSKLLRQGIRVTELPSAWDQRAWKHTKRGYFSFKAHIAHLLASL